VLIDSVRASSDGSPLRLSYLVALAFGDGGVGNQVWINIAKVGEWNGHPRGPFQFTPEVFDQIVSNTQSRVTPINCDYEHQTFKSLTGAIPSSGRILEVQRRGDELWALAELTDRAAQMVRSGEYRTCSPVIEFDATDRVTGKDIGPELLSLALTNDPFQDGLHPIKLTRIAMAENTTPEEKKKDDASCMAAGGNAVPAGAVPAVVHVVPAAPAEMAKPVVPAHQPDGTPVDPATAADASAGSDVDANAVFDSLAEAAGVDKASVLGWLADNLDKVVNMIQAAVSQDGTAADNSKAMSRIADAVGDIRALKVESRVKDKLVAELNNTVVTLSSRLEQIEKKHRDENEARIKAHVVDLQKTGYVGPEQQDVDDAVFLFSQNWERATRTYGRQIVPVGKLDTDDERNEQATGPVTMSSLSEKEKATVNFMIRTGIAQDAALQTITERRAAGKGN
jgi:Mu-like prophage I protein